MSNPFGPVLDKWAIYDHPKIAWHPHRGQLAVAENTCRHQVVSAGRRFGKSFMGGYKLLPEVFYTKPIANQLLLDGKKRIFWIVGPNFCLDEDTEILTERGWVHFHNVHPGDKTLGLNEFGECYWDEITDVNIFDHSGPMLHIKMRGHESLSTMNHKWFVEYYRASNEYRGSRFVTSENLGRANERIPCARPVMDLPRTAKYDDDLVELVAWYWTEGYYRGPGIEIAQSITANPEKCEQIRRCIVNLFNESYVSYTGNSFYISGDVADEVYQFAPGKAKRLSYQWITELTRNQLKLFIDISIEADGHGRDRGSKGLERIVAQKDKHNLDVLQMACQLYGLQTNLYRRGTDGLWILAIFERSQFAPASAFRAGKAKVVDYHGVVWCPTTKSHTWLARKNGTVYFTGNSDSEKEFRVIWNLCRKLEIPFVKPSYNNPETGDMIMTFWDGAMQIHAKSAQTPERLVGEGLSGAILSEAAKLKENIWPKYIRPTLADFNGWSFHSSTPEGKNWFYDLWKSGQDPKNTQWASWQMPAWRNNYVYKTPTVDKDVFNLVEMSRRTNESVFSLAEKHDLTIDLEILDSINELTPEAFLQEIAADFTTFTGRVFKEFDEEIHVTELQFNPAWQTFAAVDWGWSNPSVWLLIQVGPWGEINVLDEVYENELDPEDFAWAIRDRGMNPGNLRYFYPDPADPLATKILEKKLGLHARGGTGGELIHRLNHIRKALREPRVTTADNIDHAAGQTRPRLMFDRKCKRTIEDFLNYRYPEMKEDKETSTDRYDKPMKKDDHGPEALGRFFAGFFGDYGKPATGARIHRASFAKSQEKKAFSDKPKHQKRQPRHEQHRVSFRKLG